MKWSFVIQQKLKATLLLGGIMVVIVSGTIVSRRNINGIDKSFSSIYQDRLIPATTIIYLTENLYGKRLLLEKFLLTPPSEMRSEKIAELLSQHDKSIDSLIHLFEKTYLVDQEANSLSVFKNRVDEYALLEKMILNLYNSGHLEAGKEIFEGAGARTFQSTISNLNDLTKIQSIVGKELIKESQGDFASYAMISFLQVGLAIVIGLIILVFIQNSRTVNTPKAMKDKGQHFHLN
ncbi:Four helix bundle sensory module for signal transduction [Dyadobacter koreensis]|uniref:Four helix bundle sensory module for signal transduction n=1 Tax=Dyadobacter koreensis TaxID=408657 RepID=A0A1H7B1N0_9BACT|nr:MCP four helix bundle domain-containing protein [Dyadobacter koreensis]SEJ68130.1 Four helix bundle sensory module for signal transduction [Dyadobacter koreensis]